MTAKAPSGSDLVFVGDVHLERGDALLAPFLIFLRALGDTAGQVVLMGDLFNLWIGRRELEQPHQTAVLHELCELRRRGVRVCYIEGNRDYRIGPTYVGSAFDRVARASIVERFGGRRIVAVHGDLANPRDWRYRAWRGFSRSAVVWAAFGLLSSARGQRLADGMERRLRASNQAFKRDVPEGLLRRYAASLIEGQGELVILGHFHVERDLAIAEAGGAGRVLVVPEWKGTRRHLVLTTEGSVAFMPSGG